jgi:hypothetical protein
VLSQHIFDTKETTVKPSLRYYHKRTALPSDRFHHAPAARHIPYHAPTRNTVSVLVKDTLHVKEQESAADVQQPQASNRPEDFDILTAHTKPEKKEKLSFREKMAARHARIEQSRDAEVSAIVRRHKYSFSELLLHPYACMENEAYEEIPSPFLASLGRMIIKWLIASAFLAIGFKKIVDTQNFSYLRLNFTHTAEIAFRLLVIFVLAESVGYLLNVFVSIFRHEKITVTRIFAIGTMGWLSETFAFFVAGLISLKNPEVGIIIMIGVVLYGIFLKNHVIAESTSARVETQSIVTTVCMMIALYMIYKWFGAAEHSLIELLLEIYA